MPTWIAPRTWNNEVVTASKWNTELKNNQTSLKDPPSQFYQANEGANYTKTLVAWADVDSDFNFSITTTGGDLFISFVGNSVITGGGVPATGYFDVSVDGTRIVNQTSAGLGIVTSTVTAVRFSRIVTGVAAGAHTVNLQWKPEDGANTITLYAGAGTGGYDTHPTFIVRELS